MLTGDRPPPSEEDVLADPRFMAQFVEVARGFAWTAGYLAATGWIGWLEQLPTESCGPDSPTGPVDWPCTRARVRMTVACAWR